MLQNRTNTTEKNLQSPKVSQSSNSNAKAAQIAYLVSQSFDIFNLYGRESESLTSLLVGFNIALEDCNLNFINMAFAHWLKENTTMPTPADIRAVAVGFQVGEERRKAEINNPKVKFIQAEKLKTVVVAWYGMDYETATKAGRIQEIIDHIHFELNPEQGENYRSYLQAFYGFPSGFARRSIL